MHIQAISQYLPSIQLLKSASKRSFIGTIWYRNESKFLLLKFYGLVAMLYAL